MRLIRERRTSPDGTVSAVICGINRGMVFWADVPAAHTVGAEQFKRRPWLVVSSDSIHQRLPLVIAVPHSTQTHRSDGYLGHRIDMPIEEFVPNADGAPLTESTIALTEQVRALAHARLEGEPAGRFPVAAMARVDAGLRFVMRL